MTDPCRVLLGMAGDKLHSSVDPQHRMTKVSKMQMPSEREVKAVMRKLWPHKYNDSSLGHQMLK